MVVDHQEPSAILLKYFSKIMALEIKKSAHGY